MTRKTKFAIAALLACAAGFSAIAQPVMGNKCYTTQIWCLLRGYAPVRTPCFCTTPYGNVGGLVGQ